MIFRLPKTSYVKLVDYWLLFTLAIPLVEVLLHTMIANYNMKIENEKACKGKYSFLKYPMELKLKFDFQENQSKSIIAKWMF